MPELTDLFPTQIVEGGAAFASGAAVGIVCGGAPTWDLIDHATQGFLAERYHQLLCALPFAITVQRLDAPLNIADDVRQLIAAQQQSDSVMLQQVCDSMVDYLVWLSSRTEVRPKQVVWTIPVSAPSTAPVGRTRRGQRGATPAAGGARSTSLALPALRTAVERARMFASNLSTLYGTPQAYLPTPEQIAQLLYQTADPIRAERYPLADALATRVRALLTVHP